MISGSDAAVLLGAGVLAGLVGTAGGITSLVSYPALLAVGLAPLAASLTNIVALVACWPGSALASRPELAGTGKWFARWATFAVAGGLVGSGLLLSTPAGDFSEIVPYLVLAAAVSLLVQPRFTAWQERRGHVSGGLVLGCGLFLASAYNGYFGAGSGLIVLALLLLSVERDTARANALKNMLVGVATTLSALTLVAFGHVDWPAAGALGFGSFLGAMIGPVVAREGFPATPSVGSPHWPGSLWLCACGSPRSRPESRSGAVSRQLSEIRCRTGGLQQVDPPVLEDADADDDLGKAHEDERCRVSVCGRDRVAAARNRTVTPRPISCGSKSRSRNGCQCRAPGARGDHARLFPDPGVLVVAHLGRENQS